MADVLGNDRFRYLGMRSKILQFLTNVGKFAVESTIFNSLKTVTTPGRNQVHKIVKEGLKDTPFSFSLNDKNQTEELKLVMDKMHVAEEHKNYIQQHHNTAAISVAASEPLKKLPGDGNEGSDIMRNDKKRIFIRSRL